MADPQFEQFKVIFDKMPQHIKAPAHCYRIAHDIDLMSQSTPEEPDTSIESSLQNNRESHSEVEFVEKDPPKPPWTSFYPTIKPGERRRRKLPEIPPNKKPLGKLYEQSRTLSLAEELSQVEAKGTNGSDNGASLRTRLIQQIANNLYLEIDTSGDQPKPLLRFLHKDNSQTEDDSSPEDTRHYFLADVDSGNSTAHTPDELKSMSPIINGSLSHSSSGTVSSILSASKLQAQDATHRGLHKFVPRHEDEIEIDIGDPVYVQKEADDLWFEGINLRTNVAGIFPSAYVTEVDYGDFDPDGVNMKRERYILDFLGSIEVTNHKGNNVLCQAVRKVAEARSSDLGVKAPHPCILEISDHGLRMVDRHRPLPNHVPTHDYFFNLKNVTFCGYHPRDHRYFGFITKHPLKHRFACHVLVGTGSTRDVAEAVGCGSETDDFETFTSATN